MIILEQYYIALHTTLQNWNYGMLVFQITIFEKKMSFHLITFTLFFPFMQYFVFKLMKKNLLCILLSPWMKNPVEKQIKSSSTT